MADVYKALGQIQRLARWSRVEDRPCRARSSDGITDSAQEPATEPASLKLRPHVHVVDASDLSGNKAPRTSRETPVDPRHRVPSPWPLAARERKMS